MVCSDYAIRSQSIEKNVFNHSYSNSHHRAKKNIKNQNSNSCKMISKLLLFEDLRFHILTFVPLNSLLHSTRYVCKSWAATIRNSQFVEVCKHHERSQLARSKPGLYVQNLMTQSNSYFLEFNDSNGQFERTYFLGTPQRMGDIIGTCDGLLLLSNFNKRIFVVNPLLKSWLRIPPFPNSQKYIQVTCRCTIVRVPRTGNFKLFFVDVRKIHNSFQYVFYVHRIGIDRSWTVIARQETSLQQHYLWQTLYTGGNDIYWITKKEVIVMDVDREIIIRGYPLPHVPNSLIPKYLWMGNRLSCIASKEFYRTYQIFILDLDSGKWSLYHEMGPFDYVSACGQELQILFVAFRLWINDQIIFKVALSKNLIGDISSGQKNIHFGYNVKTRQLTMNEGIDVGDFDVWFHINSLVSLPSTPT